MTIYINVYMYIYTQIYTYVYAKICVYIFVQSRREREKGGAAFSG